MKRKAATSDLPTKYLVAEATGRLNEETRQKLNCYLNALYKMTRSSGDTTSGDSLLLLDSGWSEELRRSFLFGTPHTMMRCSNPTIWKFLDVLKKEQNLTDVKVAQHLSRQQPPKRAKKWADYDDRLRRIVTDYDSYDLLDFLKAVGNAI